MQPRSLRNLIAASLLSFTATPLFAQDRPPAAKPEAEIPFANLGGIENWQADGDKAIYIEGRNGRWYHAELMGYCDRLGDAEHVGFASEPQGSFDRFSAIIVRGHVCQVKSLVESDSPAKIEKAKKAKEHAPQ